MPLPSGTTLGGYEVQAQIGAGGMGEVYRARDTRLDRVVALKVLPDQLSRDPESLARFEREAKAVAALSHPNILAIFDFGKQDPMVFVVMELLEGESLRARLAAGPLPARKAVEYGLQICLGLAAAHDKGIVHRDLKPENVFITKDGRIKILDFGLAKVTPAQAPHERDTLDLTPMTQPGTVMGTVGYMSPEQVRADEADHRSDLFSFGSILYEMLSGRRAFKGDSAVETMSAILKEEPPELVETNRTLDPALERVVRHCLEKRREERFQSARDLAFQLQALSGASSSAAVRAAATATTGSHRRSLLALLALAAALAGGFWAGAQWMRTAPPSFRQVTFRRGAIAAARFAPDGQTIVYSAAWGGSPVEILTTRLESPESRSLGLSSAGVLAVSSSGEMAIALACEFFWGTCRGTLARASLAGGAPREVLQDVHEAEWTPDGTDLAVVRDAEGRHRLEFPIGHVLYDTPGWISHPRFSPRGDLIAFIDHPSTSEDNGSVAVVDLAGKYRKVSPGWSSAWGLAWSSSGREIWFTAAEVGRAQSLHAVTLSGQSRVVLRAPARLLLHDVSRHGRVLLARETARGGLMCLPPGQKEERDLSWFDWSTAADISPDGRTVLFCERGEGTKAAPTVYLRAVDGSPAVKLGEGRPLALSPDGGWVAVAKEGARETLVLLPTGPGEPRTLPSGAITGYVEAAFFPGGKRILILGTAEGSARRCYVQDLEGGDPRPVSPAGTGVEFAGNPISPEGRSFAARGAEGKVLIYPVAGGTPQPVRGLDPGSVPVRWSGDGRSLFAYSPEHVPARVYRLNLTSHVKEPWRELLPADATGIVGISTIDLSSDGRAYIYTYDHRMSELYVAEGLR
jgi:Tol biopolymer transport system component